MFIMNKKNIYSTSTLHLKSVSAFLSALQGLQCWASRPKRDEGRLHLRRGVARTRGAAGVVLQDCIQLSPLPFPLHFASTA